MTEHIRIRRGRLLIFLTIGIALLITIACALPFPIDWPLDGASPVLTPTATAEPTPTPSPTPTPTPTPSPAERLREAEAAMHAGNYARAAELYSLLTELPNSEQIAADARLRLGTALLRDGNAQAAVEPLTELVDQYDGTQQAHVGQFLLAEAWNGAGEPITAALHYQGYLDAGTVITPYVALWKADALVAGGAITDALATYPVAIEQAPTLSFEVSAREKLALAHVALEDYEAALAQYDAILDVAGIRSYRARIDHQAAETLRLAGETEQAYERHLGVVETYPETQHAYRSLVELVEAGRPPANDYLRGVVDYYAEAYGPAVDALYRYINSNPNTYSSNAHWYIGLSFLEAGSPQYAVLEFETLIESFPENENWADAWLKMAEAHEDLGDIESAVSAYEGLVEAAPTAPQAPAALWRAARLLERNGDLASAEAMYLRCQTRYPGSDVAPDALFRSGLQSYRLGRWVEAAVSFDGVARMYPDSEYASRGLLWLGKVRLQQDDAASAQEAFEAAAEVDPEDYYGLRSADLAADPQAPVFPPSTYAPDASNEEEDRLAAEQWLADWLALESTEGLSVLSPTLANDVRMARGSELWRLGRFSEAKLELDSVRRDDRANNALAQYQLSLAFREMDAYHLSLRSGASVLIRAPITNTTDIPDHILQLAYPTYYGDLVLENAEQTGFDPLVIFALIWQESQYESVATSQASAQGLMQVIPPTGQQIHNELGWPPEYETSDLYKPYVSVRFGTYYLQQQRDRFDGRIEAALAGYNGGPSNAARWLEEADGDPDLFLELITFSETKRYVRLIREHYAVYRHLYGDR